MTAAGKKRLQERFTLTLSAGWLQREWQDSWPRIRRNRMKRTSRSSRPLLASTSFARSNWRGRLLRSSSDCFACTGVAGKSRGSCRSTGHPQPRSGRLVLDRCAISIAPHRLVRARGSRRSGRVGSPTVASSSHHPGDYGGWISR